MREFKSACGSKPAARAGYQRVRVCAQTAMPNASLNSTAPALACSLMAQSFVRRQFREPRSCYTKCASPCERPSARRVLWRALEALHVDATWYCATRSEAYRHELIGGRCSRELQPSPQIVRPGLWHRSDIRRRPLPSRIDALCARRRVAPELTPVLGARQRRPGVQGQSVLCF